MAEEKEVMEGESLVEKMSEKVDDHGGDSSSSDSDQTQKTAPTSPTADATWFKSKINPVHTVLGGGKTADIILWRNKTISAASVGFATAVYVLFELLDYHLLTLVCHGLFFALAVLFLWSNTTSLFYRSPPRIPQVRIPEEASMRFAEEFGIKINQALDVLHNIASGSLMQFITVLTGLWVLSIVGGWVDFLTSLYIGVVLLHTVPVFYEKYEDGVEALGDMAMTEFRKQYAVLEVKVLRKIPIGQLKIKKT